MSANVKVITIGENVLASNDRAAQHVRQLLNEKGVYMVNVMSSPGSGKTTLLTALVNRMKEKIRIAEMDVDIESSLDAQRVADATGVRTLQIHNEGLCHIDADMTLRAIMEFGVEDTDLLILENIGNLVCPAEFDTGAAMNMTILSVPEGDDKPVKYPLMYEVADVLVVNKIDAMCVFDFDCERMEKAVKKRNPDMKIFYISAKTGEGVAALAAYLIEQVKEHNQ